MVATCYMQLLSTWNIANLNWYNTYLIFEDLVKKDTKYLINTFLYWLHVETVIL